MSTLRKLMLVGSMAIATASAPALAQQSQQRMPMMGQGMMMGGQPGIMMGGQPGMMGGQQGMMGGQQGMMGSGMGMGGCSMMGGMMGPGMQGMMGQGMPMMGTSMGMGMGCPWCGPGMMGSGYATPQVNINLSASDVTSFLERWVAGNPNIKVANVVEKDANTITADIVTKDKDALVQRYAFDRRSGFYQPVQ
jgi:hypothetical protein